MTFLMSLFLHIERFHELSIAYIGKSDQTKYFKMKTSIRQSPSISGYDLDEVLCLSYR